MDKYFGYFFKQHFYEYLSKSAQSGHTGDNNKQLRKRRILRWTNLRKKIERESEWEREREREREEVIEAARGEIELFLFFEQKVFMVGHLATQFNMQDTNEGYKSYKKKKSIV